MERGREKKTRSPLLPSLDFSAEKSSAPRLAPSHTHTMSGRHASALMGALARRAVAGPRAVLPARGGGGGPVAPRGRTTEPVRARGERGKGSARTIPPSSRGGACTRAGLARGAGGRRRGRPRAGAGGTKEGAGAPQGSRLGGESARPLSPLSLSPPHTQLAAEDELTWDDGTVNPEYCVDRWDDVGKVCETREERKRGGPRLTLAVPRPNPRPRASFPLSLSLLIPQYQALRWLGAGLGLFGGAALLAARLDKRSDIPFTPRAYPFNGLEAELAGSKGVGPRD